ncbi:hypothetical protein ACHAWO_010791 [Cyclotella atomus]|uniref:Uncharacterized protein n=1 Tax=Cyclotella atomus TaxID=382360 RepID=A0ABD3QNQ4_9STRA
MCVTQASVRAIRKSSSFICESPSSASGMGMRKTVSFSSVADVKQVSHSYPSDFFYTQSETDRFRREAREERKSSLRTYTEQLSESASSSVPVVIIMTLGIIATTIACLPILLGLKFVSVFVTDSKDIIDSSVVPSSVDSKNDTSLTERLVSSLLGESCQDDKRYSRVWELK